MRERETGVNGFESGIVKIRIECSRFVN
ncbi:unnamed protein product [Chondrus crispus]|uniref:Uncharacterized protein n=1 Tax=Chondrus crispus TaxID=2769 RepID=R7QP48_CHOCR|nr:unnamed protein product [Chondrus crispus]CDF39261.1 unnamed protein product [Chondrus crispus]|eukprot:XP_005719172.1 unnamed protein product [Chondrus crispus]